MDFMKAAIANKPNEAFATADAPKKKLDVSLSKPEGTDKSLQDLVPKIPADAAPDAPAAGRGATRPTASAIAPAGAPPAADRPKIPEMVHSGASAKGVTVPAKSAEDGQKGSSKPQPDRD
jgi:penicillin-binding protein 1A